MKATQAIMIFILFAIVVACEPNSKTADQKPQLETDKQSFTPVLAGFPQKGDFIDTNRQLESLYYPLIISEIDTVRYIKEKLFNEADNNFDRLLSSQADSIKTIVDASQLFADKYQQQIPFDYYIYEQDKNGKIIPIEPYTYPYDSVIKIPVFLINETDSIMIIENHDGKLILIQEALDRNGEWTPIEYFNFSGCGNSYGEYFLAPDKLLMFGLRRYQGEFKTKFRVRLKVSNTNVFSNVFEGSINEGQFEEMEKLGRIGWNQYLSEDKLIIK